MHEAAVKRFADLSEQEILALAITNEEEDSRIYRGFAEGLRGQYAASAKVLDEMAEEEVRHRGMLFDLYRAKFGEYLRGFASYVHMIHPEEGVELLRQVAELLGPEEEGEA